MREETAALAVALGDAVDASPAELQDTRGAVHVLALGGREERGVQLAGERITLDAELCLDGKPHGAVGRRHQRRAVDDAAGTLEVRVVRQLERAFAAFLHAHHSECVGPQEARIVEQRLQLALHVQTSWTAMAVASPPPMHRLATARALPYLRRAPISVTRMRAPEAPIGWPSAQAPPCTFTFSCGSACSF